MDRAFLLGHPTSAFWAVPAVDPITDRDISRSVPRRESRKGMFQNRLLEGRAPYKESNIFPKERDGSICGRFQLGQHDKAFPELFITMIPLLQVPQLTCDNLVLRYVECPIMARDRS